MSDEMLVLESLKEVARDGWVTSREVAACSPLLTVQTVAQALSRLQMAGLVECRMGRGNITEWKPGPGADGR